MKIKFAVIIIILITGFLASRVRFDETTSQPQAVTTSLDESTIAKPAASQNTRPVTPQNTLFNLNGEWRGVLQPLHGSNLDPRNWNLALNLLIYAGQLKVFILRGTQWQDVKAGNFKISQQQTTAIIKRMDSGGG